MEHDVIFKCDFCTLNLDRRGHYRVDLILPLELVLNLLIYFAEM